jgi:hypothetical protein
VTEAKSASNVSAQTPYLVSMRRESRHEKIMQRRQILGALGAMAFGGFAAVSTAAASDELFRIARSKNKNVVVYRANHGKSGLDAASPISAYWLMLAEDGRREGLTWAERQLAYGFEVAGVTSEGCQVTLSACSKRSLRIERAVRGFRAICTIAGQRAVLERIFVQASEGALLPSVQHVDLFGKSLSGLPISERLTR